MLNINVFSLTAGRRSQTLWYSILSGIALSVALLLLLDVPGLLNHSSRVENLLSSVQSIRKNIISIEMIENEFIYRKDRATAVKQLAYVVGFNRIEIKAIEDGSSIGPEIADSVSTFIASYEKWINIEYDLLESELLDDALSVIHAEAESMFFRAMNDLSDIEKMLFDIADMKYTAYLYIKAVLLGLTIYLLFLLYLHQRQMHGAIKTQQDYLSVALRSISDAIITSDVQGVVTYMNKEAERLTGCRFDSGLRQRLVDVFRTVDTQYEDVFDYTAVIGDSYESMKYSRLKTCDGKQYRIVDKGSPLYDMRGNIIGMVHLFREMTNEYRLQKELYKKTLRLDATIRHALDAVIVTNEHGHILEWNPKAEEIFGWKAAEVGNRTIQDIIIPPQFRERHLRAIEHLVSSADKMESGKRLESIALHRDGHEFPIDLAMTSMKHEDGWLFSSFIRDLTDIKAARDELEKSRSLLSEAQRIAKLGNWELIHENNQLIWSDEIYRIFGMDRGEEISYESFLNLVHPDDRDIVDHAYADSIKNRTSYDIVHRLLLRGGLIKYVHEIGETTYDAEGIPIRSVGTVQEIQVESGIGDSCHGAS